VLIVATFASATILSEVAGHDGTADYHTIPPELDMGFVTNDVSTISTLFHNRFDFLGFGMDSVESPDGFPRLDLEIPLALDFLIAAGLVHDVYE
jgi:hypothetical protein